MLDTVEIYKNTKVFFWVGVGVAIGLTNMFYWTDLFSYPIEIIFTALLIYGLPFMFIRYAVSGPKFILGADHQGIYYFSRAKELVRIEWKDITSLRLSSAGYGEDYEEFILLKVSSDEAGLAMRPYYGDLIVDEGVKITFLVDSRDEVIKKLPQINILKSKAN